MEKGIIEQLENLKAQQAVVALQVDSVNLEQRILADEIEFFKGLKSDLLKDIEKKIWELINFFLKIWKLKL